MRKLILTIFLFMLLLAVAQSKWEDRGPDTYVEKTVYDTTQHIDYEHWLDQVDRDSVQVIFREEHFTNYIMSGPMGEAIGGKMDSVFYDTIRYYRK